MAWLCPNCGDELVEGGDFCLSCGYQLQTRCPHCGATLAPGVRRCRRCGRSMTAGTLSFEELFGTPKLLQGRYEVQKRVRRRKITSLYLAQDLALGRAVVIKEFNPRQLEDEFDREESQRAFHAEAARWAQIHHRHIARILDLFVQGGRSYIVMEWVRGFSWRRWMADPSREVTERQAVEWVLQLCDALSALHRLDPPLIVGDLHPGHVMTTPDGQVKLIDFGLTSWFGPWLQGLPRFRGSPGYAAPEQRERWEADARSDVYAVGGLLYFLLTGYEPHQPPSRLDQLPPALREIVRRTRQRRPESRFQSVEELRDALMAALPGRYQSVETPVAEQPPESRRPVVATAPRTDDPWRELLQQLAGQAASDWLRFVRRFYGGHMVNWLLAEADRLERAGLSALAERARQIAADAEAMATEGELREPLERQAVAARWLCAIGAVPDQPAWEVKPSRLPFGSLTRRTAKRARLHIHNAGSDALVGEVQLQADWLEARPTVFSCPPGEVTTISVIAHGSRLPAEGARLPRGVELFTNRGVQGIEVRASLETPSLIVTPSSLDFGLVQRGMRASAEIGLRNEGGGEIVGQVKSTVSWLSVERARFRLRPDDRHVALVTFHADLAPESTESHPDALVVDSDWGQAKLPVAWSWATPSLEIEPAQLEWGDQPLGAVAERTVTLRNAGTGVLEAQVVVRQGPFHVTPKRFTCHPGEQVALQIQARWADLPPGQIHWGEALVIEGNAGRTTISAAANILAPRLEVRPLLLDFGEMMWGETRQVRLKLANTGNQLLHARLVPLQPWLRVDPQELDCSPGDAVRVSVEAHTEVLTHGGEWADVPAIDVITDVGARSIPAFLCVYRPEMTVMPETLDFGVIERQGVGEAFLFITNTGNIPLTWSIACDGAWVEVEHSSGETPPGSTSQVRLRAYGLAIPADVHEASARLTVQSNAGERDLRAVVNIARPRLWVAPLQLDLGQSINREPLEGVLSVFNRGLGDLIGSATASEPWIAVEPASFAVPTGGQQPLTVQVSPEGMRQGEHLLPAAIRVTTNAGEELVDLRFEVLLRGELAVSPDVVRWRVGDTAPALYLANTGQASLSLSVTPSAPWLQVNHPVVDVKPGRRVAVAISLEPELMPEQGPLQAEILLEHEGEKWQIPIIVER